MKMLVGLVSLLLLTSCISIDPIRKEDVYRHAAMTGLMVVDWRQSVEIAKNPDEYWEKNPLLSDHPTEREVNTYFLSSYLTKSAISYLLPHKYRGPFQYVMIGASAVCVGRNFSIGLGGEW